MKNKIIPYNPNLKALAKKLRENMTLSEVLLWNELSGKKMHGFDFDRQRPIDNFIVDFYCKELNLAIEIDGDSHDYKYNEDVIRQKKLESLSVHFLRFLDIDVKKDMNNVLREIEHWVLEHKKPTPNPSEEGS
jgi:very-short-patch-repair endonuclease